MQGSLPTYSSSNCRHNNGNTTQDDAIGELFRDWGEIYIKKFKPSIVEIKLIRSIRICRTPALGGKIYRCKNCGDEKYLYFGCGNSRCPKCQGLKRMQWQEKITNRLYDCPYQHIVFTLPSELRGLTKRHPSVMFNVLMRSAWKSLDITCQDQISSKCGAIMVLHTFGSDLKYHVHVHALVTFGGIHKNGKWQWPRRKNKIVPFRAIRSNFRNVFLKNLENIFQDLNENITYHSLTQNLKNKSWTVHQEPPTSNAEVITTYLSKYINRIGLSIKRFRYDKNHKEVTLSHKDYKSVKSREKPPMITKNLKPLDAINQILQHCLPPYFQKTRYYGIHSNAAYKKYKTRLPKMIESQGQTVKTILQLVSQMLGYDVKKCEKCDHCEIGREDIRPDKNWIYTWLTLPHKNKDPCKRNRHIKTVF